MELAIFAKKYDFDAVRLFTSVMAICGIEDESVLKAAIYIRDHGLSVIQRFSRCLLCWKNHKLRFHLRQGRGKESDWRRTKRDWEITFINYFRQFTAMKFKVILEEAEEGGYVVYVPALPGCVSQGETREEALKNIKEAIEVYLDVDDAEIEAEIKGKKAEVVEITL